MNELDELRQPLDRAMSSFELSERVYHMAPEDKTALLKFLNQGGLDLLRQAKGETCTTASR